MQTQKYINSSVKIQQLSKLIKKSMRHIYKEICLNYFFFINNISNESKYLFNPISSFQIFFVII